MASSQRSQRPQTLTPTSTSMREDNTDKGLQSTYLPPAVAHASPNLTLAYTQHQTPPPPPFGKAVASEGYARDWCRPATACHCLRGAAWMPPLP